MDTLFRDLHDSPSGDKSDPARAGMSAEKPSVRVSLDLTGYGDYFKQAAKLKQDIWPAWGKTMSQHEPQGQTSEAKASQSASEANDAAAATPNDPTKQFPSYLSWDAQKAAPSLYRAFLQEFQSPTQGSVGNLIKRLVERAHKHEHQRLTQELSEKEQLLQEQASQLHAMTADRDKWMMDHQQLVASAKQQSKMTEAQLRAAASVTAKRADDEALHARQKLAELQQQLSSQAGGNMVDRQTSGTSNSGDHSTSPQASTVTGGWSIQSLPGGDGKEGPQEPNGNGQKVEDSRQHESGKATNSGQNESGKDKDSRQDLSPGQQQVERLCAELRRAQIAYEDWAEGTGRHLASAGIVGDGEVPSCSVYGASNVSKRGFKSESKSGQEDYSDSEWTDTSDSDASFRHESECEVHEASAEPDAVSRLIHSAVCNDLNAGTPAQDSNLDKMTTAEEELKEMVNTLSIRSRRMAYVGSH
ncbi:hypothetical protein WJX79_003608 [Trebouxia sp. C0005]